MQRYPYTDIVMVLALLTYLWMSFKVGGARGKYDVQAPSVDGPPEFQRIFRVHMNTLEQIVIFLPALWLFASTWGDLWAAVIGVFWPVGRIIFALAYFQDPKKRSLGFGITFFCSAILLVGGLIGTIRNML